MKVNGISNHSYNPHFEKLNIHEMRRWEPKLLDAVLNSKGIQEAAKKHDMTIFRDYDSQGFAIWAKTRNLIGYYCRGYYIAANGKSRNINTTAKKILNFDAKQFDNFVKYKQQAESAAKKKLADFNARLEAINNPPKTDAPKKNNNIFRRFLNLFK